MMRVGFLLLSIFLPFGINAQNAEETINRLREKMKQVKEYTVKAQIDTRLPFIKMLPVGAEIYFKQPDIFQVKSKGIAIVPRQGMDQISRLLQQSAAYTLVPQGSATLMGIPVQVMTLIPNQDTGEVLMGKLWIDPAKVLVMKSQLTTRTNGTVTADFTYGTQAAYGLPDKMVFHIDVRKFKIPKAMTGDMNTTTEKPPAGGDATKGTIAISFSQYVVNRPVAKNP